ncbi:hypothetical protein SERLA73DRAFT_70051 [Serpula lacrymans var. lacrymans S7.3]|uniref:Uncharacterized protein n=2 Tax=Serpula lacrymans var. lacrymans TaxID=341189 RepID=F8PLR0_SERL3|nr:uncharacterized protein SERLADRAFT_434159 [Serpula lacrymans var. lacrymans S7.9]EGO02542.1 hypothetical protein SERLA73DRAFT_70051 [Serpula lacrymans var. lacrymans S7.3]EGO28261.1 hypothetical protein SERLADRAFT_434159 [Serpula lacrymans var. lacrymans S7.9]
MEFLWVRSLGLDLEHRYGSKVASLPKVGFVPQEEIGAFAFADGRSTYLLREGPSAGRFAGESNDWAAFYVNIFVNRDMFVRYTHQGVSHQNLQVGNVNMRDNNALAVDEGPEDLDLDLSPNQGQAIDQVQHLVEDGQVEDQDYNQIDQTQYKEVIEDNDSDIMEHSHSDNEEEFEFEVEVGNPDCELQEEGECTCDSVVEEDSYYALL